MAFSPNILEKVRLENFRNLSDQIISFDKNVNCVFGENGNGKTNLLEALYFSINKRSFRKKASFQQILSSDCGKPEILSMISIKKEDNEEDYYSIKWENSNIIKQAMKNAKLRKKWRKGYDIDKLSKEYYS